MRRIIIWLVVLAAVSAVSFGLYNKFSAPKSKSTGSASVLSSSGPIKITIMGDSVAKGTGDEKGSGFSTYLPEYIRSSTQRDVTVYNAGVNGLKSPGLADQLKSGKLDSQIADSSMIVISIGGNDLLTLNAVKDSDKLGTLKDVESRYIDNLKQILNSIREKNPDTYIVFTGLYNPKGDGFSLLYNTLLGTWNSSTDKVIDEDSHAVFIDTNDIFKSDSNNYISPDGLHPNSAGYQAVSQKIAQLVTGTK